ncbi:hypothetical protein [Aeromicrobium duanguangcaii]|uniref:hypothetical protein n=1 Tax=Aeromicrobium duanguangcaii TaxID=2968086 RepID=UPI002016B2ED|nr:hypothetical protein [Aeromicrobium duanguangcaii]MCL3836333.1 hypothetical protein [Aeromicrobium duanguangcaii]
MTLSGTGRSFVLITWLRFEASKRRRGAATSTNIDLMDSNPPRIFRVGYDYAEVEDDPGRFFSEAVGRWDASAHASPSTVIQAACEALVAGLDSGALRELAGLPSDSRRAEVDALIAATLDELSIPRPQHLRQGHQVGPGGRMGGRPAIDRLRLSVEPAPESVGGFEIQVFVNDVEMTAAGAGMGMDPYDLLIPKNRFIAEDSSHRIPIARCECGTYGCGVTDVSILRDDGKVHWDWHEEVPMSRGVTFAAVEYDSEVARVAADRSWETPDRTAGRLVLADADRDVLAVNDLEFGWVANDHRDPSRFACA